VRTALRKLVWRADSAGRYAGPERIVYNVGLFDKNIAKGTAFEEFEQSNANNAKKLFGW
jgi:hypothetical protein